MRKTLGLTLCGLLFSSLTSCLFLPPPLEPSGYLAIVSDSGEEWDPFACVGDTLTLGWLLFETSEATLSAKPPDATRPELNARRVLATETELEVEVVKAAKFTLDVGGEYGKSERSVRLIPDPLCTGFPARPLGTFAGVLEQTEPSTQTLPRTLRLVWDEEGFGGYLGGVDGTDGLFLSCTANADADTLRCTNAPSSTPTDGTSRIDLSIAVSAAGLSGSYQGVTRSGASSTPFSGTLTFTRTP